MAKASTILVLTLSLLLILSIAESRSIGSFGVKATLECDDVYGVETGDTCAAVIDKFKLNAGIFDSINPNLDCDKLFVGQWLCIDGTSS